jgi:hypothetical protein
MITHKIKPLTFNNTYTLTKRNTMTGEEESYEFHNIVLSSNFVNSLYGGYGCRVCQLGSGSGIPSSSDTSLFNFLFKVYDEGNYSTKTLEEENKNEFTYKFVFPASSSYVGTITEVGLAATNRNNDNGYLITHALITDSEGNPISVEKTAIDEIIVTVKFVIERPDPSTSKQKWSFSIGKFRDANSFGKSGSYMFTDSYTQILYSFLLSGLHFDVDQQQSNQKNEACADSGTMIKSESTVSCTAEWASTNSFVGFVNSIIVGRNKEFRIQFPNTSVFPVRQLENIAVGTGDGITTDFVPEIPLWIEDTEIIYVNGVAKQRGVDYLVDSVSNLSKKYEYSLGNFVKRFVEYSKTRDSLWCGEFGIPFSGVSYPVHMLSFSKPIVIEYDYEDSFSSKVNMIKTGSWNRNEDTWTIPRGTSLVFETSSDGTTFSEIYRVTTTSNGRTSFPDSGFVNVEEQLSVRFLRIRIELPEGTDLSDYEDCNLYLSGSSNYLDRSTFLGYVGEYSIRFIEPPEEGAIITASLGIDRPYKSSNFVIQYNPVFNF